MRKCIVGIVMVMILALPFGYIYPAEGKTMVSTAEDFRAVWVASVLNLDYPSKSGLTVLEMKMEAQTAVGMAAEMGFNAIILQVRPCADALYKSKLFPWSAVLTGTQGVAPADGFDPLQYWINLAHSQGLELHAWINPYRITHTGQKITDVSKLAAGHPARQNPAMVVSYNGALYFDPGLPESKQLIVDGVTELIQQYDIDGIHLDDYFYPGTSFKDDKTYAKYGGGLSKDDWRRENVNDVIRAIQKTIQDNKPSVRFGVSPTGIWQNDTSTPLGSATRGYEHYKSAYADTRRWVEEGWLDYICPQLYWNIGYGIADYAILQAWWSEVCRDTGVDLYIGIAAYREANGETDWDGEVIRQLTLNAASDVVKGSVLFRINFLSGNLAKQITTFFASQPEKNTRPSPSPTPTTFVTPAATVKPEPTPTIFVYPATVSQEQAVTVTKLTVAQPSGNVSLTSGEGYTIIGTCKPGVDLYMNGELVENRTPEGFFSVYVPLSKGSNSFRFTQAGQTSVTRKITLKDATAAAPKTMQTPAITGMFPASDAYISRGDTVTFSCTAPAGAVVSVKWNGETIALTTASTATSSDSAIYAVTYTGQYTIERKTNTNNIANIGRPVYSMVYKDKDYTATASGNIRIIGQNAGYYATVTADSAWVYPNKTTNGGSSWLLEKGQRDRIVAISGDWVKLSCGMWIEKAHVICETAKTGIENSIANGEYRQESNEIVLAWPSPVNAALHVDLQGYQLAVRFGLQSVVPDMEPFPEDGLITSYVSDIVDGVPQMVFTLREDVPVEGYYVDYADDEIRLHIKLRKSLTPGDKPLTGFTFVIDAGHGGGDTGALGPMGAVMTEKDINLINALKLTQRLAYLGATVVTVREQDTEHTLYERIEVSRKAQPDMFISMHANSVAETTNATGIRGLTVWYRNAISIPLAETLTQGLFSINPGTTRYQNIYQSNFYVCRPSWAPSVIIEASFMCNIQDYAWMINDQNQNDMADAIVNTILSYYR